MHNSSTAAKWFSIRLTVLLLIAFSASCRAEFMRVTAGFDGVARTGAWTPITVEFSNPQAGAIEGTLEVAQGDGSIPVCSTNVNLPANSTKLYHIYARLREYGDVRLSLRAGDRLLAERRVNLNFAGTADRTIVSVGLRTSALSFLNREQLTSKKPGAGPSTIFVGSVPAAELPDRPAAYEGVDVLVISNLAVSSTNPKALSAIGMWVASGGTLVVSTGPDYRAYQNEFFDDLLPVRITGAGQISSMSSLERLGQGAFPAAAVAVATSDPKPGIASKVVLESGIPVYAERAYGAGKVIFLAFDHLSSPFKDWNGQVAFWKIIVSSDPGGPLVETQGPEFFQREMYGTYNQGQEQKGLVSIVRRNASIKMPAFLTIALFLLAYIIVLVPVNYFALHKLRRRELAWITTPAIVCLFTIGAYGIGYTMKGGRLQLNEVTFIQGSSGARYASAVTEAAIFSPASRGYDVTLSDPFALGQVLGSADDRQFPMARIGEELTMDDLRIAMWSSRTLESSSGVDLGGQLETDLTLKGNVLSGTIRNNTGMDLTDCALAWGKSSIAVKGLRRGGTATVSLDHLSGRSAFPAGLPDEPSLKDRYREFARSVVDNADRPMLLARFRDRRLFDVSGGPRTESYSYLAFDLGQGTAATGGGHSAPNH